MAVKDLPVVIGRQHHTDRFTYSSTVSRDHFRVSYNNEGLLITNLRPTNPTSVKAYFIKPDDRLKPQPRRQAINDGRTQNAEDRVREHPNFHEKDKSAPYGYYMNHPIIGRNSTSVDGGVYLGGSAREAIVVDGKSEIVRQVYEELAKGLRTDFERARTLLPQTVLTQVMRKVQQVMPYNELKAERISSTHYGDKLVGLSTFIKEKVGVCRHQGLLAAYLIERLINDEFLTGSVGVERNTIKDMGGTHAWAVYKARPEKPEDVIVIDPTQSFVGTKQQAQKENLWEYRLSTDDY